MYVYQYRPQFCHFKIRCTCVQGIWEVLTVLGAQQSCTMTTGKPVSLHALLLHTRSVVRFISPERLAAQWRLKTSQQACLIVSLLIPQGGLGVINTRASAYSRSEPHHVWPHGSNRLCVTFLNMYTPNEECTYRPFCFWLKLQISAFRLWFELKAGKYTHLTPQNISHTYMHI